MRTVIAAAVACLLVAGLSGAADVQASSKRDINIPAGGLGPALTTLSKDRRVHIVFISEDVHQLSTEGASGSLSVEEALNQLLKGTGLTYEYIDAETISIIPIVVRRVSGAVDGVLNDKSDEKSSLSGFRLADGSLLREEKNGAGQTAVRSAQEPSTSSEREDAIQEVVVTAQKREERLQDVPISISVLSGNNLDASTDMGLKDALNRVPGVLFLGRGSRNTLSVRGVTALPNLTVGTSPIAFYLDSVPFGFVKDATVPDTDVYDLDRVEVLRGPQGTLYGANALNGVVRLLTKDANLNAFEFKARTSLSGTEHGGENYRGDLAVNVPIVEGKLAARAVLGYQDWSGWIDRPIEKDANDAQRRTLRLKLNAQPTEQLSIGLSAWFARADDGAASTGFDSGHMSIPSDEPMVSDYDTYNLKVGYDFERFSIASMTSYLKFDTQSRTDIRDQNLPGIFDLAMDAKTFAQEISLTSTRIESWRWSTGGMYRDSSDSVSQIYPLLIPAAPLSEDNESESIAVFGELTRLLLNGRWELTAGLRYFEDEVTLRETSSVIANAPKPSDQLIRDRVKYDATTVRAALTWHPTEQLTAYASYGEGFRGGGFQNTEVYASDPDFPALKPDELTNYEVGTKGSLWGGRLNFDMALYYIDWQDVQLRLVLPSPALGTNVNVLVNGASASGVGVDFALVVRPVDRFELGINASWSDLTLDEDVFSRGVVIYPQGSRVGQSPEYTAGVSADYVFPLGSNGFEGRFSTSANYVSDVSQFQLQAGRSVEFVSDSILIARTSFSIRTPDHWQATLFVDNINNENGFMTPNPFPDRRLRVSPRTVGLQMDYRF